MVACSLLRTFEFLYKCGCRRRAQGLVYVACIFTHGSGGIHVCCNDSGECVGLVVVCG
jgi:hypothetical protein